jgi:hypothetical protein
MRVPIHRKSAAIPTHRLKPENVNNYVTPAGLWRVRYNSQGELWWHLLDAKPLTRQTLRLKFVLRDGCNRNSSVSIVTRLRSDDQINEVRFSAASRPKPSARLPVQRVRGNISGRARSMVGEAGQSSPSSSEVNEAWSLIMQRNYCNLLTLWRLTTPIWVLSHR